MKDKMTMALVGLLLLMFPGCAHLEKSIGAKSDLISQVEKAWRAKVEKDWDTVYDLTVEDYKREISKERFVKRANVNVSSFSVEEAKLNTAKDTALVKIKCEMKQAGYSFKPTIKEEWVKENGAWRLNLMTTMIPPFSKPNHKQ